MCQEVDYYTNYPISNTKRQQFISREDIQKVLDACPNNEWRLIFGLVRWGGLRCPSEVLRLKWKDIDFERSRFTVHASKTERHADSGIRTVPMFPELRPLFQDAFEAAKDGDVYCIKRYRDKTVNLRTQLSKIIRRAGFEPWPKLFQNCRSTRETELFKMTGGNVKAVCSWIGNSPVVAMQHYAQVTEADEREAIKMSLLNDAENQVQKRVHNRVQNVAEWTCTDSHETQDRMFVSPYDNESNQELAAVCGNTQNIEKYPQGESNLNSQPSENKEVSKYPTSERVHNRVQKSEICPELEQIITAWPHLPEQIKKEILTLISSQK